MSLKSFDINHGFNGEPSTASVTIVSKVGNCNGGGTVSEGNLEGGLRTGNSQVDALIKDFIISKKEVSVQAGFKEIKYQLVDKQAKRLSSIAVLVRGITAAARGSALNNLSLIYDSSERNAKGGYSSDGISILNGGRVAVIGKAFSEISVSIEDKTLSRTYNKGGLVSQTPTVPPIISPTPGSTTPPIQLIQKIDEEESIASASIRYGYYLSEFQTLLSQCGYSASGFPSADKNLILDFGGSLKECVSSVASMFGLYYTCRGTKITFYKSSEIQGLQVPNFTNDSDNTILSASYSEDILGKQTVGVIKGSVNPKSSFSSNNTNISNSGGSAGKTVFFYRAANNEVYQADDLVSAFFTIFKFGGSEELFDRIILRYLVEGGSSLSSSSLVQNYFSSNTLKSSSSKSLADLVSNSSEREEIQKQMDYLGSKSILYSLKSNSGEVTRPSKSELFAPLKALCETAGGLYVSSGVSSKTADGCAITAPDGFTVSQPYEGSTPLKDVAELSGIVGLYSLGGKDISNANLASFAREVRDPNSQSTAGQSKFYYIAQYDFLKSGADVKTAAEAVKNASKDLRGTVVYIKGNPYFAISSGEKSSYASVISTSKSLWSEFASKLRNVVRAKAFDHDQEQNNAGDAPAEEDPIEYPSSWVSFLVRAPSDNRISDISIAKFEGTIDEASYKESQFTRLVQTSFNSKSSSVTYSGLKIPADSPILVGVSLQFSAGSVQTTVEYSNSEFIAESNEVIMSGYSASSTSKILRSLTARQKNALGLN